MRPPMPQRLLAASKEDSLRFLEWIESWFRDLLAYSVTRNPQDVVNIDMLPQIQHAISYRRLRAPFLSDRRGESSGRGNTKKPKPPHGDRGLATEHG